MGINDEYSRDAYLGDPYAYNSDEEGDEAESQMNPEDWQALYSDELLDAWTVIYDELIRNYLTHVVRYPQFIEFVMDPGQWSARSAHTPFHTHLWNQISPIDCISKRVSGHEFHGWSQHYLSELF